MGYYKIDEKLLDKQFEFKIGSRHYGQMYYEIIKKEKIWMKSKLKELHKNTKFKEI